MISWCIKFVRNNKCRLSDCNFISADFKINDMSKKNKSGIRGFVYSTDPGFSFQEDTENVETLSALQQKLKISLDTKRRAGKAVTLVENFIGQEQDLEDLSKKLKTFCGTGGSAKDGEIIIQGDQREKVLQWLLKNGYSKAKKI